MYSVYLSSATASVPFSCLTFHFANAASGRVILPSVYCVEFTSLTSSLAAYPTCTSPLALTFTAVVGVTSSTFLNEMLLPSTVILFAFNLPRLIISPAAELVVVSRGFVPLFANSFNCASVRLLVERYRFPTSTLALESNKIPLGLMR